MCSNFKKWNDFHTWQTKNSDVYDQEIGWFLPENNFSFLKNHFTNRDLGLKMKSKWNKGWKYAYNKTSKADISVQRIPQFFLCN